MARCKQNIDVFIHYCKNEMTKFNYLKDLAKVKCPTLLMVGLDSPLHPKIRTDEMANEIQRGLAKIHYFKQAGVPVYKDAPIKAYKVVSKFLTSI